MSDWAVFFLDIGRMVIGAAFIVSSVVDIFERNHILKLMHEKQYHSATLVFITSMIVKFVCGIAILVGFWTSLAAIILAVYVFFGNFVLHPFWSKEAGDRKRTFEQFVYFFAILGGLLILIGT